jgi:hypothetical protein
MIRMVKSKEWGKKLVQTNITDGKEIIGERNQGLIGHLTKVCSPT